MSTCVVPVWMSICVDEYLRVRNAEEIVKERKAWHYDQLDCGKCCFADSGGGGASSGGFKYSKSDAS